jgi:hypothetical protein
VPVETSSLDRPVAMQISTCLDIEISEIGQPVRPVDEEAVYVLHYRAKRLPMSADDEIRSIRLCYVMLCYVMLCYVMLCYVMLCYVMLCYVMLCYVMLWLG